MSVGVGAAYFSEIIQELSIEMNRDLLKSDFDSKRVVVVAPQEGQVARATQFKEKLEGFLGEFSDWTVQMAFISRSSTKDRDKAEEETHKHLIGDVKGSFCILVDDIIDTGSTMANAVKMLRAAGAGKITGFASHGRFSQGGDKVIENLEELQFVVITNTLPHRDEEGNIIARKQSGKIRELTLAPLFAEAIYCLHNGVPFSDLLYNEPFFGNVKLAPAEPRINPFLDADTLDPLYKAKM
mmetsp:Transcript_19730/g.29204  ORF Transcript_19730/g.29204 Transcript_19730/m.29204 type:complete len:240 (+) Transcript_19730:459-1178(+)